jgi:hypothetical protein
LYRRLDCRPFLALFGLSLTACTSDYDPATFEAIYNDVFATSCVDGCHSATVGAGNLFLEGDRAYDSIVNGSCDDEDAQAAGLVRITPGQPIESFFYLKMVNPEGMGDIMPPAGMLDEDILDNIEEWILRGALEAPVDLPEED